MLRKILVFHGSSHEGFKKKKISLAPSALKRLRDVQMSSLSENDSDNESQDSSNDSDNNSLDSEIRKSSSHFTFQNHGTPDSNSELIRLGLISQQSQSQLTPQSQTQLPRSPQKGGQQKFLHTNTFAHKVFITKKDKADVSYKKCKCSVKLAWTDGTAAWEPPSVDVKSHPGKIADCVVENDLFKLTKKSKLWGSESVMNKINERCEACDKQASSNKRKRKDSLTQCDTSDKTPVRDRSKRRR